MAKKPSENILVATNRKARHNYLILETFEAGLELAGPEVKSLRLKQATMESSFARADGDEIYVYGLHIAPYEFNHVQALDPLRKRKLLLKKKELRDLIGRTETRGESLVPLELYFRNGWAKLRLGLAKGKKAQDKRESIKKKELDRELRRDFKNKHKV